MEHAEVFKNKRWNLKNNPKTNGEQVQAGKNGRDVVSLMERQHFGPTVVGKAVINTYGDNVQCPKLSLAYHSPCHAAVASHASQRSDANTMQQITRLECYGNVF